MKVRKETNPMRSRLNATAVIIWFVSLSLLIPDREASFMLEVLYLILPRAISTRPEITAAFTWSYLLSIVIVVITSISTVLLSEDRGPILRAIVQIDALAIGITLLMVLLYMSIRGYRP
jgi:hypothetical protein